ncbi:hypothetical protein KIPB_000609 [Kipferlia bialata]|uniref:Armadillo-type fold n=1 Tax=Kipferlia bialata TaxID=797122 RepID=A0A9K3GEN6_9EUKA|nr:hypothetical protein KIPB_000609 [Kipferlia bialata]|eukprot:g609.t1
MNNTVESILGDVASPSRLVLRCLVSLERHCGSALTRQAILDSNVPTAVIARWTRPRTSEAICTQCVKALLALVSNPTGAAHTLTHCPEIVEGVRRVLETERDRLLCWGVLEALCGVCTSDEYGPLAVGPLVQWVLPMAVTHMHGTLSSDTPYDPSLLSLPLATCRHLISLSLAARAAAVDVSVEVVETQRESADTDLYGVCQSILTSYMEYECDEGVVCAACEIVTELLSLSRTAAASLSLSLVRPALSLSGTLSPAVRRAGYDLLAVVLLDSRACRASLSEAMCGSVQPGADALALVKRQAADYVPGIGGVAQALLSGVREAKTEEGLFAALPSEVGVSNACPPPTHHDPVMDADLAEAEAYRLWEARMMHGMGGQ